MPSYLTSAVVIASEIGFSANESNAFDSGATGDDRCLVVVVAYENGSDPAISAMTYDGDSLTKQEEETVAPADNFSETIEIWTLVNPSTGSNTLAFTNSSTVQDCAVHALVYTDVNQTTPVGNTATAARLSDDDMTVSITITSGSAVVWGCDQDRAEGTSDVTAATDNTKRQQTKNGLHSAGMTFATGDRTTGSGSVTAGGTQAVTNQFGEQDSVVVAVELNAPSSGEDIERTLTESLNLEDSTFDLLFAVRMLDDIVATLDASTTSRSATRLLQELLVLNDSISKTKDIILNDAISVNDVADRVAHALRLLLEAADLSDAVSTATISSKQLTESLNVDDDIGVARIIPRVLFESAVIADEVSNFISVTLGDNATLADGITAVRNLDRRLLDALVVLDEFEDTAAILLRTLTDSVVVADESARSVVAFRPLFDAIDTLDLLGQDTIIRKLIDSLIVEDEANIGREALRKLTETIDVADAILASRALARQLTEQVDVQDAFTLAMLIAMTDQIDTLDDMPLVRDLARLLQDIATLQDTVLLEADINRLLSDSVVISDEFIRGLSKGIVLSEEIDLSDNLIRQITVIVNTGKGIITAISRERIQSLIEESSINTGVSKI